MRTLYEAVQLLKRVPDRPVEATIEGLTVEVRVVTAPEDSLSAAAAFAAIGRWDGESTEELLAILARARRSAVRRAVTGS